MPKTAPAVVEVPDINVRQLEVVIIGDSSFVCHAWSDKARKQIEDKQGKKAQGPKKARDPKAEYEASLYPLSNKGGYGIPCRSFKMAAVNACKLVDGLPMTLARIAFHVNGDLAPIEGSKPRMRTDMVRIGQGTADVRYRGEFPTPWRTKLSISYDADVATPEQIIHLFNRAGFGVGIGEMRPSSKMSGPYGRYHVAKEGEV